MKKETVLCIILGIVSLVLCVAGYFILPSEVVVQIGFDGRPSSTMPKLLAIILPVVFTLIGILISRLKNEKKGFLVSAVGILAGIITIFMNR